MKKKALSLALALALCLNLGACTKKDKEGVYTPGAYVGVSENGMGGKLTVEVTVDENAITAVEVTGHAETAGISDPAIEKIPAAIKEANSTEVDSISGATITSDAIKEAVANALAVARGEAEPVKEERRPVRRRGRRQCGGAGKDRQAGRRCQCGRRYPLRRRHQNAGRGQCGGQP